MSGHDPIADGRDWYPETDLSEHIASGRVARAPRPAMVSQCRHSRCASEMACSTTLPMSLALVVCRRAR